MEIAQVGVLVEQQAEVLVVVQVEVVDKVVALVEEVEQSSVNFRVQGLDSAIEEFWKSGKIGNFDHWNRQIGNEFGSATGREEFHSLLMESFDEGFESGFIGHREEGASNAHSVVEAAISSQRLDAR